MFVHLRFAYLSPHDAGNDRYCLILRPEIDHLCSFITFSDDRHHNVHKNDINYRSLNSCFLYFILLLKHVSTSFPEALAISYSAHYLSPEDAVSMAFSYLTSPFAFRSILLNGTSDHKWSLHVTSHEMLSHPFSRPAFAIDIRFTCFAFISCPHRMVKNMPLKFSVIPIRILQIITETKHLSVARMRFMQLRYVCFLCYISMH